MIGKRGQGGLSMNVIIIAIIALVVLVVVAAFFLGGFTGIGERIATLFRGTADIDTVIITCENLCSSAEALPTLEAKEASGYCKNSFYLDTDRDGKSDRGTDKHIDGTSDKKVKYYCWSNDHVDADIPTKKVPGVPACDVTCL